MSFGMAEYQDLNTELLSLGVDKTTDTIIARMNKALVRGTNRILIKNVGEGNATITLMKRGKEYPITAENINALQVGSTLRFRGQGAQRRVTPGSIVIVDANVTVVQRIEDTNKDGILWQTDGPTGPTYPVQIGTIDYNENIMDFTLEFAVTLPILYAYKHTNWTAMDTPVSFAVVAGGAVYALQVKPVQADNFAKSMSFDEEEMGIAAKKTAATDVSTFLNLNVEYHGVDEEFSLPLIKGEISGYPNHNA